MDMGLSENIVSKSFLLLAGFFLFAVAFSLVLPLMPYTLPDYLRRYVFQIYLFLSLVYLWHIGWRPLIQPVIRRDLKVVVFIVAMILIYAATLKIMDSILFYGRGRWFRQEFVWPVWDKLLLSAVVAPVLEELFFRDVILRVFYQRFAKIFYTVLFSSFFFMCAHFTWYPGAFLLGVVAAGMVFYTRSVLPGIVLHSLSNLSLYFLPVFFPHLHKALIDWGMMSQFYR